jgi:hypothetical protein
MPESHHFHLVKANNTARVKIMEPGTGTVLIINQPGTNDPMVSVHEDGTLTVGEGYTPDAAAREFWEAMAEAVKTMWPYLPKKEIL